jgi:medium-chain acyl-[acyl-carrier-protein] hydrolase
MQVGPGKWTLTPDPRPRARTRLICFHHAGGGAYGFRPWATALPVAVELVAVQLPGRENRRGEAAVCSAEAVLDALAPALEGALDRPCIFFGHSLGAVLAYLMALRLQGAGAAAPVRLFLSAAGPPPDVPSVDPPLSDAAVIRQVSRLGGTPQAVLDDPALMRAFMPTLRADFELLASCAARGAVRLEAPLTLLAGADDRTLDRGALDAWAGRTTATIERRLFPGGHFYLQRAHAEVLTLIASRLAEVG